MSTIYILKIQSLCPNSLAVLPGISIAYLLNRPLNIPHRNSFRQPNPVVRLIERMPILVHLLGLYAQYPGLSVSHSYRAGDNGVGGEVDVVPTLT